MSVLKKTALFCFSVVFTIMVFVPVKAAQDEQKITAKQYSQGTIYIGENETHEGDIIAKGNSVVIDGILDGNLISFGGTVTVKGTIQGDLVSLGGPVEMQGTVEGELVTIGTPLDMSGGVYEDVVSIGGPVTLENSAVIEGDITTLGATLNKTEQSQIMGDIVDLEGKVFSAIPKIAGKLIGLDYDYGHKHRGHKTFAGFAALLFALIGIGILIVIVNMIMPSRAEVMAKAIALNFWKTLGIGILVWLGLLPAVIALMASVIGIPLIPFFMLAFLAGTVICMSVFSLTLGQRVLVSLKKDAASVTKMTAYGYLAIAVLIALGSLMCKAGGLLCAAGWLFGLGGFVLISAALTTGFGAMFITKFGKTKEDLNLGNVAK